MAGQSTLNSLQKTITALDNNRVANFSYTDAAFNSDDADGVVNFDVTKENNIPTKDHTDLNPTILNKGLRSDAASFSRAGENHYRGRTSYNLNKLIQKFKDFLTVHKETLSHNCNEYDATAQYFYGDMCYVLSAVDGQNICTYYKRISTSPPSIAGTQPPNHLHWAEVLEKEAYNTLVNFTNHAANTTTAHDATPNAAASKILIRDENGRAQISNPATDLDVTNKRYVDYKPPLGIPYFWLMNAGTADDPIPDWALSCNGGGGYAWANYPNLDNAQFRRFLELHTSYGAKQAHNDAAHFALPDFSGLSITGAGANSVVDIAWGGAKYSSPVVGTVQLDASRNITGQIGNAIDGGGAYYSGFVSMQYEGTQNIGGNSSMTRIYGTKTYDASRVVPTHPFNRPAAITGIWIIRFE